VTTSGKNPVGLLFAGGSSRTYANEIGRVLGNFSVTIDTDGTPPPVDEIPPAAPSGLTATGGDGQVLLDWANNSETDLAGYNVYRGTTSGGTYSKVNSSLVTTSAYTDTGLANGTPYYYVVRAVDLSNNESANSNEASATPLAAPPAAGPTNLTASAFRQGTVKVDLAWTGGASSIDVHRQNPGASFTLIATTSNSGSYRDNLGKRPASGSYTYRVCSAGTTLCSGNATVSVP
jgi:fibronectin type 3 domain-containing protein